MDIASIFQTWINVLTKPSEATFEAERQKPNANLTNAIIWIIVAAVILAILSVISTLISRFIGGGARELEMLLRQAHLPPETARQLLRLTTGGRGVVGVFCFTAILTPVGFLIGSGIYFLVAKLLGGKGKFEEQTYLLATFHAPLLIISGVVGIIPFLGGCISFLIVIYQLVLTYLAIKVTHGLTSGKAVGVILIPILVIFLCIICVTVAAVGFLTFQRN